MPTSRYDAPLAQDMDNNPMQPSTWARIKSLAPHWRMIWNATGNHLGVGAQGTYKVGRNAEKRAKRAAAKEARRLNVLEARAWAEDPFLGLVAP